MDVEDRESFISWMRYEVLPPKMLLTILYFIAALWLVVFMWALGQQDPMERIEDCRQFYLAGTNDYYECIER